MVHGINQILSILPIAITFKFRETAHMIKLPSMLESVLKTVSEKGPEATRAIQALLDEHGGVSGLMQKLKEPETRQKMKTWFEDGKTLVLSQEQVQKILGNDTIKKVSERLSSTPEKVTMVLAETLPPILKKLEEIGSSIPENSAIGKAVDKLKGLLK